jgi:predicted ATPase
VASQSLRQPIRQRYHERIVQVLTCRFPEMAETQPELVAHHATAAGWSAQAIVSWQRAGEMALARSAQVEAMTCFRRGLELLMTLPETPVRVQSELILQRALSTSLLLTRGFAALVCSAISFFADMNYSHCDSTGDAGFVICYDARAQFGH